MFNIVIKKKPRWYQFRWKVSNLLVRLARKIHPKNPEITAFYVRMMTDQMIHGRSVMMVDPTAIYKEVKR